MDKLERALDINDYFLPTNEIYKLVRENPIYREAFNKKLKHCYRGLEDAIYKILGIKPNYEDIANIEFLSNGNNFVVRLYLQNNGNLNTVILKVMINGNIFDEFYTAKALEILENEKQIGLPVTSYIIVPQNGWGVMEDIKGKKLCDLTREEIWYACDDITHYLGKLARINGIIRDTNGGNIIYNAECGAKRIDLESGLKPKSNFYSQIGAYELHSVENYVLRKMFGEVGEWFFRRNMAKRLERIAKTFKDGFFDMNRIINRRKYDILMVVDNAIKDDRTNIQLKNKSELEKRLNANPFKVLKDVKKWRIQQSREMGKLEYGDPWVYVLEQIF